MKGPGMVTFLTVWMSYPPSDNSNMSVHVQTRWMPSARDADNTEIASSVRGWEPLVACRLAHPEEKIGSDRVGARAFSRQHRSQMRHRFPNGVRKDFSSKERGRRFPTQSC